MKPQTHYTKSGRLNIAYQIIGEGPVDIVYIPGWVSNIDLMWSSPELSDFLTQLSKQGRVILFDKRGTGLSDRVTELSSLEERMDDIRAVLDAVDSKQAILFGHSEGGSVSLLFAATYPERIIGLMTFGVFAKRRYSEDYPWAPTDEERQLVYDMIEKSWGSGDMDLASLAPSKKNDAEFMSWLASYFRSGASPSAALVLTQMNTQVDIIDILPTIQVPTLLLYRTGDIDVKVEEGRFIHERIPNSKFIEFPGEDHLFWAGDVMAVLQEITGFVKELKSIKQKSTQSTLATILNISIEGNDDFFQNLSDAERASLIEQYLQITSKASTQFRGNMIATKKGGTSARFDGAIRAVYCAITIRNRLHKLNLQCKIGLHTGMCSVSTEANYFGEAIDVAFEIQQAAFPNQILISNSVKNLIHGGGLNYNEPTALSLSHQNQSIYVFGVNEQDFRPKKLDQGVELNPLSGSHSILDHVLESINTHISDENYGVEILCVEVGMSERQLQRKMKSITNKSPNQMIRSYRLHRAKELLSKQINSVSEVAYKTGFKSVSYFTKCFKKEFGLVPTELLQLQ